MPVLLVLPVFVAEVLLGHGWWVTLVLVVLSAPPVATTMMLAVRKVQARRRHTNFGRYKLETGQDWNAA